MPLGVVGEVLREEGVVLRRGDAVGRLVGVAVEAGFGGARGGGFQQQREGRAEESWEVLRR